MWPRSGHVTIKIQIADAMYVSTTDCFSGCGAVSIDPATSAALGEVIHIFGYCSMSDLILKLYYYGMCALGQIEENLSLSHKCPTEYAAARCSTWGRSALAVLQDTLQ